MTAAEIASILSVIGPSCRDNTRRQILLEGKTLVNGEPINGIDYVEFESPAPNLFVLHVHFLRQLPADAFTLTTDPAQIHIHGGTRITGITVLSAKTVSDPQVLDVTVDNQGDFSQYLLSIGWQRTAEGWQYKFALDRPFSVAAVNFRAGCPVDFDCATTTDCAHESPPDPQLDYLARDYASFRQLLLDLVAQRNPSWVERSPADIGIALLELFAYEGDQLAYMQDAVAAEMYLDTARRRESAKRHARLIDYQMHDGANARTYVHFRVGKPDTIPPAQLLTGINKTLMFEMVGGKTTRPTAPPGTVIEGIPESGYTTDPALALVRVFQTSGSTNVFPEHNELRIHSWGNDRCCLSRGETTIHLYAVDTTHPENPKAIATNLAPGTRLLLEEVLGPNTGKDADADPTHRQVVTITRVETMVDPLFLAALDKDKSPRPVVAAADQGQPSLPLAEVSWGAADALTFPLCLTTVLANQTVLHGVSVARGNIAPADHGRTVTQELHFGPALEGDRVRVSLGSGPMTMVRKSDSDPPQNARPSLEKIQITEASGTEEWSRMPDLITSSDIDRHFVVDLDHRGRGILRFGDGEYGRRLAGATAMTVAYRVGNGRPGNIGAEAIRHIVTTKGSSVLDVRNPLPGSGGADPESIEEVRQYAPAAFRAQRRAVTADDYRSAALTVAGVADAVAAFRWFGSWYTVLVGIDPVDRADLLLDQPGHVSLAPELSQRVIDVLNEYRLAGYDLEVRGATYVPLDIAVRICVAPGYFGGDVAHAVALSLSGAQQGGRGLFNPAHFSFGQPVYLSTVYAAIEEVPGVESAEVTEFYRHGRLPAGELQQGVIPIGPWEIAQLDNDPNRMENGALVITTGGGS